MRVWLIQTIEHSADGLCYKIDTGWKRPRGWYWRLHGHRHGPPTNLEIEIRVATSIGVHDIDPADAMFIIREEGGPEPTREAAVLAALSVVEALR